MVKRKDFNATLKQLTDGFERMRSGNRFHSDGAATANERAPNFVAVLAMTRSSRVADRSLRLALTQNKIWEQDGPGRGRVSRNIFLRYFPVG